MVPRVVCGSVACELTARTDRHSMAIQRADNDDRPRRRWWNRHGRAHVGSDVGSHSNSHAGSHGGSPDGSDGGSDVEPCGDLHVGSYENSRGISAGGSRGGLDSGSRAGPHGNSHGGSADEAHVEANGATHAAPYGAPDGDIVLQRHGDSIIVVDVDGALGPSAHAYAVAFLEYLQIRHLARCGSWVSSNALQSKFYPRFLEACRWPAAGDVSVNFLRSLVRGSRRRILTPVEHEQLPVFSWAAPLSSEP